MEDNTKYNSISINPAGGGSGSGVDYYEHFINYRNVKMTQNPAYVVHLILTPQIIMISDFAYQFYSSTAAVMNCFLWTTGIQPIQLKEVSL